MEIQARKQEIVAQPDDDIELEEPRPNAEKSRIGRKILAWMDRNKIPAKTGLVADKIIEALSETSLPHPSTDDGEAWMRTLAAMPDEHVDTIKIEVATENVKFQKRLRRAKHVTMLKKLNESAEWRKIVRKIVGEARLRGSSRARKYWQKLKLAVKLGTFVIAFVDAAQEGWAKQDKAREEEEEAAEAKENLEREAKEAEEAEAEAEAARAMVAQAEQVLEEEERQLEDAKRTMQEAIDTKKNAETAVLAAEQAIRSPVGTIMLLRLTGLTNADDDGQSDPMVKVYWNDELIHESEVRSDDNNPEIDEEVTIGSVSSIHPSKFRCEVWDHDDKGKNEFLGQYEVSGFAAEMVDNTVVATDMLPTSAATYSLEQSTHFRDEGKYVGGSISLGAFRLHTEQAALDLKNARVAQQKASEVVTEATETANREKQEAEEQNARPKPLIFLQCRCSRSYELQSVLIAPSVSGTS